MKFKNVLKRIRFWIRFLGVDPETIFLNLKKIIPFFREYFKFKKMLLASDNPFILGPLEPQLKDKYEESGTAKGHYFHQDLLVAQKVFQNKPEKHVDIGSRFDGFVAHVASFRELEVWDIRKLHNTVQNVVYKQANICDPRFDLVNYCDSVSSLHVFEHFGLGRYGDKLDPDGYIFGLNNVYKMLKSNGKFYFSVPIGQQIIRFNNLRVFSLKYLLKLFELKYKIDSFACVNDKGDLIRDIDLQKPDIEKDFNFKYGCGIFELTKI